MNGRAKILTQDQIFTMVREGDAARNAAQIASVKRKDAKGMYKGAMEVWRVREMDRKEQNGLSRARWAEDVKKWEVERDEAKIERRKAGWTKPKMPTMEKIAPRPKISDFVEDSEGDDEGDAENEDADGERSGGSDVGDGDDSD
ncbi:hypothetical protein BJ912DRAFT_1070849 [Pholiota molesta]|nr:hypothetical protein BJ912DRAFT_1070849 [Pholiota molesta]